MSTLIYIPMRRLHPATGKAFVQHALVHFSAEQGAEMLRRHLALKPVSLRTVPPAEISHEFLGNVIALDKAPQHLAGATPHSEEVPVAVCLESFMAGMVKFNWAHIHTTDTHWRLVLGLMHLLRVEAASDWRPIEELQLPADLCARLPGVPE